MHCTLTHALYLNWKCLLVLPDIRPRVRPTDERLWFYNFKHTDISYIMPEIGYR